MARKRAMSIVFSVTALRMASASAQEVFGDGRYHGNQVKVGTRLKKDECTVNGKITSAA